MFGSVGGEDVAGDPILPPTAKLMEAQAMSKQKRFVFIESSGREYFLLFL